MTQNAKKVPIRSWISDECGEDGLEGFELKHLYNDEAGWDIKNDANANANAQVNVLDSIPMLGSANDLAEESMVKDLGLKASSSGHVLSMQKDEDDGGVSLEVKLEGGMEIGSADFKMKDGAISLGNNLEVADARPPKVVYSFAEDQLINAVSYTHLTLPTKRIV